MSYHVRIDNVQGSNFAVGENAHADGVVSMNATDARLVLRDQLATLLDGLAGGTSDEHAAARVRARDLQAAAEEPQPDGEEVERSWTRLKAALATLGITGAVAFGADLAQIGSSVAALL